MLINTIADKGFKENLKRADAQIEIVPILG